ncbi:MAG: hypothetical protein K8L91_30950 [Anaerolineae bacterium]|nr:hypothetical protein [Anaerolineae bacterium]
MTIGLPLSDEMLHQLEDIARKQNRDVMAVIYEAVEQYIKQQVEADDFDARIDRLMEKHKWLLDELAKQ